MQYGKAIYNILDGTVGVSNRIYPELAPQLAVLPYLVYKTVSIVGNPTQNKTSTVDTVRVQINIIAKSFAECQSIEESLRSVLCIRYADSHGTSRIIQQIDFISMDTNQYDDNENNFIISCDYELREVVNSTD